MCPDLVPIIFSEVDEISQRSPRNPTDDVPCYCSNHLNGDVKDRYKHDCKNQCYCHASVAHC